FQPTMDKKVILHHLIKGLPADLKMACIINSPTAATDFRALLNRLRPEPSLTSDITPTPKDSVETTSLNALLTEIKSIKQQIQTNANSASPLSPNAVSFMPQPKPQPQTQVPTMFGHSRNNNKGYRNSYRAPFPRSRSLQGR